MIPMIKKILFTTDLSDNSVHAFTYAAVLAARHGARIVLLHVMEESTSYVEQHMANLFGQERWQKLQEGHKVSARDVIIGKRKTFDVIREGLANYAVFTDQTDAQVSFDDNEIVVKDGKVIDEILAVAAERECDLIVLGSHKGLTGRTAIGGVAKAVLQQTRIPVLVVPPAQAQK
jgi:nucleotide-binding universal stress UspA family protein